MITYTEPKALSDVLLVEVKPDWTKDHVTITTGKQYEIGTVLAKVSGQYQLIDPAGTGTVKKISCRTGA